MRYVMKQRMFSLTHDFYIRDEEGRDVFVVEGTLLSLVRQMSFRDLEGRELGETLSALTPRNDRVFGSAELQGSEESAFASNRVPASNQHLAEPAEGLCGSRVRATRRDESRLGFAEHLRAQVHAPHGEHDARVVAVPSFGSLADLARPIFARMRREPTTELAGRLGARVVSPRDDEFLERTHGSLTIPRDGGVLGKIRTAGQKLVRGLTTPE